MKLAAGFVGILATMLGWAFLALQWPGPKPAILYIYVPAVVIAIIGSALYWFWSSKKSN